MRAKVRGTAERPRLSVFRSNRGMQRPADRRRHAATRWPPSTWTEADLRDLPPRSRRSKAGELVAERAKEAGVEDVVFDRGGYRYHGRVERWPKALARAD